MLLLNLKITLLLAQCNLHPTEAHLWVIHSGPLTPLGIHSLFNVPDTSPTSHLEYDLFLCPLHGYFKSYFMFLTTRLYCPRSILITAL